ncbi:phage baseplate protein [Sporolactobacillus pectinivorans]|uniref:phage baseplate protein n=1 Tax=Sporolactobacillus pectinivorans TaxID=1591408 RepID=UPI000C25EC68|nr:LysM domain-containing protein [Sporolactobacillus pectinivorans]
MAKLGNVDLLIESEKLNTSVQATAYPVDSGEPITDHVQRQPQTLTLDGFILSDTGYKTQLQYLRDCLNKGTLLHYTGRCIATNVIIISIDDSRTADVGNGSALSIQLQYIRIVKEQWTATKAKAKTQKKTVGKKKKTIKKKSSKVYVKVKSGNTYWGMMMKYGTLVSTLEKWNPWPARRIPIGVRMRVK